MLRAETNNTIIAGDGVAATIAITGQEPERTIGRLSHVAEPTKLALEQQLSLLQRPIGVEREMPEPRPTQRRHKQRPLPLRNRSVVEKGRAAARSF